MLHEICQNYTCTTAHSQTTMYQYISFLEIIMYKLQSLLKDICDFLVGVILNFDVKMSDISPLKAYNFSLIDIYIRH
jgi:hypothetical protein